MNATGVFLGTKYAIDPMLSARGGSIINISSIYGIVGSVNNAAYHASKGAVRTFTKSAAAQYATQRIRVNSVHPGFVDTPMTQPVHDDPGRAQPRLAQTPAGRFGQPIDIAFRLSVPRLRRVRVDDRLGTRDRRRHDRRVMPGSARGTGIRARNSPAESPSGCPGGSEPNTVVVSDARVVLVDEPTFAPRAPMIPALDVRGAVAQYGRESDGDGTDARDACVVMLEVRGSLAEVLVPFARVAECPGCRADLHVCRMCEFFDPGVRRGCKEPVAEEVSDRERANFCGYFTPAAGAGPGVEDGSSQATSTELAGLFDLPSSNAASPDDAGEARRRLDELFGREAKD